MCPRKLALFRSVGAGSWTCDPASDGKTLLKHTTRVPLANYPSAPAPVGNTQREIMILDRQLCVRLPPIDG